ncbi:MAG: DUF1922 domain-containing protein [Candidatus Odinarchaeia archaeon]
MIFKCMNCHKLNLAKNGQKTRLCPFCGSKNQISKVNILFRVNNAEEAVSIIRAMKLPKDLKITQNIEASDNKITKGKISTLMNLLHELKEKNVNKISKMKLISEAEKRGINPKWLTRMIKSLEREGIILLSDDEETVTLLI